MNIATYDATLFLLFGCRSVNTPRDGVLAYPDAPVIGVVVELVQ